MSHTLDIRDGTAIRRDFADVDQQAAHVRRLRDLNNDRRRTDGNSPWNEAFSFTADFWELSKKLHPELHDPDPRRRFRAWQKFATTRVGQAFRVR